mgnify:CR=1 FL=1
MLLWIWLVHNLCRKLEYWLYIFTTTRANRVCKSFSLSLSVCQLNCLRTSKGLSLGELIRPFCIMLLYRYLLHYGLLLHVMSQYLWLFSLILQGLHEEGECRQLEFWAGKGANIRDLFCTTPNELKLHGDFLWNI